MPNADTKKPNDSYEILRNCLLILPLAPFFVGLSKVGDLGDAALFYLMFLIVLFIYFTPSLIAFKKNKSNSSAIFLLNLFAGWTIICWIIAAVWASSVDVVDVMPNKMTKNDDEQDTKTCPYCAETVKKAAVRCRHCGSSLES